jgi:hypothetical protein
MRIHAYDTFHIVADTCGSAVDMLLSMKCVVYREQSKRRMWPWPKSPRCEDRLISSYWRQSVLAITTPGIPVVEG